MSSGQNPDGSVPNPVGPSPEETAAILRQLDAQGSWWRDYAANNRQRLVAAYLDNEPGEIDEDLNLVNQLIGDIERLPPEQLLPKYQRLLEDLKQAKEELPGI